MLVHIKVCNRFSIYFCYYVRKSNTKYHKEYQDSSQFRRTHTRDSHDHTCGLVLDAGIKHPSGCFLPWLESTHTYVSLSCIWDSNFQILVTWLEIKHNSTTYFKDSYDSGPTCSSTIGYNPTRVESQSKCSDTPWTLLLHIETTLFRPLKRLTKWTFSRFLPNPVSPLAKLNLHHLSLTVRA